MARREKYLGHSVIDGVCQYTSPSALTIADPNQYGGCLRRWLYRYRLGKKEPMTVAQKKGDDMHDEIEGYLKTGEKLLGPLAMSGMQFIPPPLSPRYDVEFEMVETERVGEIDVIRRAPLTAAGLPVVGYGDLLERNAPTYLDEEGEVRKNPDNTCEATDWKSTSNFDNAKAGPALRNTVQMTGYGEWAARTNGTPVDYLRLSHVYFGTRGAPKAIKRTTLVPRAEIAERWEQVEGVARTMIDAARETNPDKVPANDQSCDAWKGCPHASYCSVKKSLTLDQFFGQTLSKEISMSVLGKLNLPGFNKPAEAPAASLSMADAVADLKRREAEAAEERAKAAAPPVVQAPLPVGFKEAIAQVEAAKMGRPGMNPIVAACYSKAKNLSLPAGQGIEGEGLLAQVTLIDPAQMIQLGAELAATVAATTNPVLPPEAPASKPETASKPIEQPAAPVATPEAAAPAEAPKKKRGRPAGSGKKADAETDATEPEIYVNCLPRDAAQDLAPYVATLCKAITDAFNPRVDGNANTGDLRTASNESPIGFGKWKGALAALARENLPPPGVYYLWTDSEPAIEVASALYEFVAARGRSVQ